MKKLLAFLLAALMVLSLMPAAAASGIYDEYGPMWSWDSQNWTDANGWSADQWVAYWEGEIEAEDALAGDGAERILGACVVGAG